MNKPVVLISIVVGLALLGAIASLATKKDSTPTSSSFAGPWKDGTYTGQSNDNIYGTVQVGAVVSGGKITDIQFLQMPSNPGHTDEVTAMAKPALLHEAISAQNANVDTVSGATQDTDSFKVSLQSALDKAK